MKHGWKRSLALLLAAVLALGGLTPALAAGGEETITPMAAPWDILDLNAATDYSDSGATEKLRKVIAGGDNLGVVTQKSGYVNVRKGDETPTGGSSYKWLASPASLGLPTAAVFTAEVAARLGGALSGKANEISVRVNNTSRLYRIYLKWGTVEQGGGIANKSDYSDLIPLDTTVWRNYAMVIDPTSTSYGIYVDGVRYFENATTTTLSGGHLLRIGADSDARANIDVQTVRIGNGDLSGVLAAYAGNAAADLPETRLVMVTSEETGEPNNRAVTVYGQNYDTQTSVTLTLLDSAKAVTAVTATGSISGDTAVITLPIPADISEGMYYIKAATETSEVYSEQFEIAAPGDVDPPVVGSWESELEFPAGYANPAVDGKWRLNKGGALTTNDIISDGADFINVKKVTTPSTNGTLWAISPAEFSIPLNSTLTFEARVKVNAPSDPAKDGGKIAARVNDSASTFMEVFVHYGVLDGFVSTKQNGSGAYTYQLDTTVWHDYRMVVHTDRSYSLYVDGALAFANAPLIPAGGIYSGNNDLLKIGAELNAVCDMDIAGAKYAYTELIPDPAVPSVYGLGLSAYESFFETNTPIDVGFYAHGIAADEPFTIELVDDAGLSLDPVVQQDGTIADGANAAVLTIPGTVPSGDYYVKVTASGASQISLPFTIKEPIRNYLITASATPNGEITPAGLVEALPEANRAFTIIADADYKIARVWVDGIEVDLQGETEEFEYTFNNVTAEHTIHASFVAEAVTVAPEVWSTTKHFGVGAVSDGGWRWIPGSSLGSGGAYTQKFGYANIEKWDAADSGKSAWIGTPSTQNFPDNTGAFTTEAIVRVNVPEEDNVYSTVNKISIRADNNKFYEIYISYGEEDGYILLPETDTRYYVDTTVWHAYRMVISEDHLTYSVYVDGALAFRDAPKYDDSGRLTGGGDLYKFGAEAWEICNMDILSAKVANGALIPNPQVPTIVDVTFDARRQEVDADGALEVTASTNIVPDGTAFIAELVDKDHQPLTPVVTAAGTITGDAGVVTLNIPAAQAVRGTYYVKITTDAVANSNFLSYSYRIEPPLGEMPVFPSFVPTSYTIGIDDYAYAPTKREFNFPSLIDISTNTSFPTGLFNQAGQPFDFRYYLIYAPHDAPAGMYVAGSDSLDGPWTEYGDAVVKRDWQPNYSVSHVSAGDVVWIEEQNAYIMYYHGENHTGRWAKSTDLINWTYGGETFKATQFTASGNECSYGKVFAHEVPGLGNKYIQLLMVNDSTGVRKIFWAHSPDGISWTPVKSPLVIPDPSKAAPGVGPLEYHNTTGVSLGGRNLSGPFWMPWEDESGTMRYYVIAHASSGNMYIFEVGEELDMEIHWGIFYDSNDGEDETDPHNFDFGRAGAPYFMKDAAGFWHMFYEGGVRLKNNIVHAVQTTKTYAVTATVSGSGGSIAPAATDVIVAQDHELTITPDEGYVISALTVNGESVEIPQGNSYTVSYVTADVAVEVTFADTSVTHTITASAGENGTIDPSGAVEVQEGTGKTFTITPANGYVIDEILVDGTPVAAESPYTFTSVSASHTIAATFKVAPAAVWSNEWMFPAAYAAPNATGKWRLSRNTNPPSGNNVPLEAGEWAITEKADGINIWNNAVSTAGKYLWAISPDGFVIAPNVAFTMETRARVNPPADAELTEGNKIGIRIDDTVANNGGEDKFMELCIGYGDKGGFVSTKPDGSGDYYYPLDTTVWHDYRIVVHADRSYSVYVDNALVFANIPYISTNAGNGYTAGADLLKVGGESWQICNIDVQSVKCSEAELIPNPLAANVREIAPSAHRFYIGEDEALDVTVTTGAAEDSTAFTAELLDANYDSLSPAVTVDGTINGNTGTVTLPISGDLPFGDYHVKVTVAGAVNSPSHSRAIQGEEPLGSRPVFPHFVATGNTIEMEDYLYNETNEFNFPSILDTRDHPVSDYRYYLFYAPHDNPGGICVAWSNSLDGPWIQHDDNPVVRNVWEPHYSVSHVSSGQVIWNEGLEKYIMYFHGENPVTRYATSDDLVNWTYGDICVTASNFASGSAEASYAKVFEHEVPGLNNKYIMLVMVSVGGIRNISWAHSEDGIAWTEVPGFLITPDPDKAAPGVGPLEYHNTTGASMGGRNLSGPFWMPWEDETGTMRYYVIAHASSGNMYIFEVGEKLDKEIHWGIFYDSNDSYYDTDPPAQNDPYDFDGGRSGAPSFIQDDEGVWHMYYEGGKRLRNNIVHAVEDSKAYTITATAGEGGTISPSGVVPVTVLDDQAFTITPAAGYAIDTITVDGAAVSVDTGYTFSRVIGEHTIAVTFRAVPTPPVKHTITATAGEHGTISPDGAVEVAEGADQVFTITPAEGYEIDTLLVDDTAVTAALTYTFEAVTAPHTIAVTFRAVTVPPVKHTITATAGENGTISPDGAVEVAEGADQTFTITPNAGYKIDTLTVDGTAITPAATHTFLTVAADHTIAVTFRAVTPVIWNPDKAPDNTAVTPKEVVETDDGTVEITLDEGKTTVSDEASAKAVALNETMPIVIQGDGLSVIIPAGTLSEGADLNAMLVDLSGAAHGNVVKVTLPDGTEQLVPFSMVKEGTASYIVTVEGSYEIVDNSKTFSDQDSIPDWASDAVGYVAALELFRGNEAGAFDGSATMSRNMMITVLGRIGGASQDLTTEGLYTDDVPDWASPYVAWGTQLGIVQGSGSRFRGDENVTREQLCVMLSRLVTALNLTLPQVGDDSELPDLAHASDWARDAVSLMVQLGVLQGDETGELNLQGDATRYEVTVILERFIGVVLGAN